MRGNIRGGGEGIRGTSCWAVAEASHGADISVLPRSPPFAHTAVLYSADLASPSTNGHDSTIYLRRSVDS